MTPDEANTIRNRINMYDRMLAEQHALQARINKLSVHKERAIVVHFSGISDYFDIPPECREEVHEAILSSLRGRIASLAHEMGELTSPAGNVSHK